MREHCELSQRDLGQTQHAVSIALSFRFADANATQCLPVVVSDATKPYGRRYRHATLVLAATCIADRISRKLIPDAIAADMLSTVVQLATRRVTASRFVHRWARVC